jgi:glycosyltransferase involved in cell wall biosynthesis
MEIALLHYTAPPIVGGVERVIGRHAVLMADAGHAVRIVAGRGGTPDPRVRFVDLPLADSLHPDIVEVGERLAAGQAPPDFGRLVQRLERELSGAVAGSEVVIAHNIASLNRNLSLTAALHELCLHRPPWRLILWHHDMAWTMPGYLPGLHPGEPWSLLRRKWPGAIDVTISAGRRSELAALLGIDPADIAVIPGGIDLPVVRELGRVAGSDPLLLAPVRVTARKNLELAFRVVAEMRARGRNAGLVVTGPLDPHSPVVHEYRAGLDRLIDRLGIGSAVVFLADTACGSPSDAELAALYETADALVLPSSEEGFGLPILEAAAARLPIFCSDLESLRAIAGAGATYFAPDADPAYLAAIILRRLDSDPAAVLAHRVRADYAWPHIYERQIEPLLQRAAGPVRT